MKIFFDRLKVGDIREVFVYIGEDFIIVCELYWDC